MTMVSMVESLTDDGNGMDAVGRLITGGGDSNDAAAGLFKVVAAGS